MKSLVFVYNADTGLVNGMFDFFHKMIKPSTYSCSLCMLTHHSTGKRDSWKSYLSKIEIEKVFLHRDEFLFLHPDYSAFDLPLILVEKNNKMDIVMTAKELKDSSLQELMSQVDEAIF